MKEITFVIPIRIDSSDRLSNLRLVTDYLKNHLPEAGISILEADKQCCLSHLRKEKGIRYQFVEDRNPVFFRTYYLNQLTEQTETPCLAIWDTDILLPTQQIQAAYIKLKNGSADFVFPYDGRLLQVLPLIKENYSLCRNFSLLESHSHSLPLLFGANSYGGAFMVNREKYRQAGGENENIYGWGPEDLERVKRWQILGYQVDRIPGPAYHLYHPQLQNSKNFDKKTACRNNRELFRICAMSRDELYQEIIKWKSQRK